MKEQKEIINNSKILLIGFYLILFIAMSFNLYLNNKEYDKERMANAYIEAYQQKDIERLGTLFFTKGTKNYKEFIKENKNIFEERKNLAFEEVENFYVNQLWYNKEESCALLGVHFIDLHGELRTIEFEIYFTYRWGKIYFSRLIEGYQYENINYPHINKFLLTVEDKSVRQYAVKESDLLQYNSFEGCNELLTVSFPAIFPQINPQWFENTPNLEAVEIDEKNAFYTSVDGVVYSKDMTELVYYPRGKINSQSSPMGEYIVPDTVKTIKENAFTHNTSLRKITLLSVETIEQRAFYRMEHLQEIILNEGLERIGKKAFEECKSLEAIILPNSLRKISSESFMDCESLENVQISQQSLLSEVGWGTFDGCKKLAQIYLPNGVKAVENWAFKDCYDLSQIRLPLQLEKIGLYAFENCFSLEELEIKQTVQDVRVGAFYKCNSLSLTIEHQAEPEGWQEGWDLGLPNEYIW